MKDSKSKNKKMPENTFDAEVWTADNETLLSGFNNPGATCNAINFALVSGEEDLNIYVKVNGAWGLAFTGPRPANPPGR